MEPGPQKESIGEPAYRIVWHPLVKEDLSRVPKNLTESIVKAAEHRLSRAPQLIGQPLKGTTHLLWKITFDSRLGPRPWPGDPSRSTRPGFQAPGEWRRNEAEPSLDKYRIVYTIRTKTNEVWILSVQKREVVYRDRHIQSLVNLAIAIRQKAGG